MDPLLVARLDARKGNEKWFDSEFSKKLGNTARSYLDAGLAALNFHCCDFDAVSDLVDLYAPVEDPKSFPLLDRNSPLNFRHPFTLTECQTLTTFLAQILFGGEQARSVEAQNPDDDAAAESINALLAWNDDKLGIYLQGWLWIWSAVVYNRGIWFERGDQICEVSFEDVEEENVLLDQEHAKDQNGNLRYKRNGDPVMAHPKRTRQRKKRTYSGYFNNLDLVSPYDFVCDPTYPFTRFQEGRFAGHRVLIPWNELKRRSELDPSDDQFVLPHVVSKIKTQKGSTVTPGSLGGVVSSALNQTRTFYDRQLRVANAAGIGGLGAGLIPGSDAVNKDDGGNVECFNLTIRVKPKMLGMYKDDDELELVNLLITNQSEVLSVNVMREEHDQYPYCVAEGKPNGHRQFSPGWGLVMKPIQDRIDMLNRVHSDAQARMGNILLIDQTKCDISNLLARDKNGLWIFRTEAGSGLPAEELVYQIPVKDVTAGYNDEMAMWVETGEKATGVTAFTQGQTEDPGQTLGQFDAVKQMAIGRISSTARLLSEQGLRPQTRRWVCNLQQFCPEEQMIRVIGRGSDFDPDNPPQKWKLIKKADIQGGMDVVAHDGALPGADTRIIAAASRAIEAYSGNPALAPAFDNKIPGAMDPVRILRELLKKSGLPVEDFSVTRQQAQQNLQAAQLAQGIGMPPPGTPAMQPGVPGAPPPPQTPQGIPSASTVPPVESAGSPQAHPGNL